MSELYKKISSDMTAAIKAGNPELLSTLRFLVSELRKAEIDKYPPSIGGELSDEDVISVLQKSVKQHKESIEMFEKGNRVDLVEKEKKELEIVNSYLPRQMEEMEVRTIVEKAVVDTGAKTMADIGKVMGVVMGQVKGKADGSVVSRIVKETLS
jgi:uncharacterized protein